MGKIRDIFDINLRISCRNKNQYTICIYREDFYEYNSYIVDSGYIFRERGYCETQNDYCEYYEVISHDDSYTQTLFDKVQDYLEEHEVQTTQIFDRINGRIRFDIMYSKSNGMESLIKAIGLRPTNIIDYNVKLNPLNDVRVNRYDHIYLPCANGDVDTFMDEVELTMNNFRKKHNSDGCRYIAEKSVCHIFTGRDAQVWIRRHEKSFIRIIKKLMQKYATCAWIGEPLMNQPSEDIFCDTHIFRSGAAKYRYDMKSSNAFDRYYIYSTLQEFIYLLYSVFDREFASVGRYDDHVIVFGFRDYRVSTSLEWVGGMLDMEVEDEE